MSGTSYCMSKSYANTGVALRNLYFKISCWVLFLFKQINIFFLLHHYDYIPSLCESYETMVTCSKVLELRSHILMTRLAVNNREEEHKQMACTPPLLAFHRLKTTWTPNIHIICFQRCNRWHKINDHCRTDLLAFNSANNTICKWLMLCIDLFV